MPYRHAHWYLLALFPLVALAFWPSYFAILATAPVAQHAHAAAGTLWIAILTAQSWLIHHGRRDMHRQVGVASLALFPLFMASAAAVFVLMAQQFASRLSPLVVMYDPRFALASVTPVTGFAYCYYQALRQRRKVHLHSRYMLSTVLFLLPPIVTRLITPLPPLHVGGPQDFWKLGLDAQLAFAVAAEIAFILAWRAPKHGRPFVEAGAFILAEAVLFQTVGGTEWWGRVFATAANIPLSAAALAAGLGGIIIGYAGWVAGKRPTPRVDMVPA